MSKMYMKYGSSMKSFKLRVCVLWGKWRDFSLECTSVGQNCILIQCIFSCAINMCMLGRILCGYVNHSLTLLFPPASEVWEWECPGASRSITGAFFFKLSYTLYLETEGSRSRTHVPHNRARYKDVTLSWFFKAFSGKDISFILHLECLIFMPVFIMFHLTCLMYPLSNQGI